MKFNLLASFTLSLVLTPSVLADVWISPLAIEKQIQQYVEETQTEVSKDKKIHWHVTCFKLPQQNVVMPGEDLQVVIFGNQTDMAVNRKNIHVHLKTELAEQALVIPVKVQAEKQVWVATELVAAKENLTAAKLKKQTLLLDDLGLYALSGDQDINKLTARVCLQPGKVVDTRQVIVQPVVFQNEPVRLEMMMANGVKITTVATALQNGAVGDMVLIKRTMPNKKLARHKAKVISHNTVAIEM